MKRSIVLVLSIGAVIGTTHAVSADPPAGCRQIRGTETPAEDADDVIVCRQDVWIHKNLTPLGNIGRIGNLAGAVPSWDTNRPTGPLATAGAYASDRIVDVWIGDNPVNRPTFAGTFQGILDTLGIRFYLTSNYYTAQGDTWPVTVKLEVDGITVFEKWVRNNAPDPTPLPVREEGNLYRVDFALINLYEAMKAKRVDLSSDKVHSVELQLMQAYENGTGGLLVYDSAEAASGLVFNLEPANMSGLVKIDVMVQPE